MKENALDSSKLIVSWNRYEQGLMKAYLLKCAYSNDYYCFGDKKEFPELYNKLMERGFPPVDYDICSHERAVEHIKGLIRSSLKPAKEQNGNALSWINDENETDFLMRFAMAIQDTKIRGTFIPENINHVDENGYVCQAYYDNNNNLKKIIQVKPELTIAKAKLLSLATQLTRIGLNCKTTVHNSNNLRGKAPNAGVKTINFIDTNNFLGKGVLQMDKLDIGMSVYDYYFNLYRKLFDFALKRELVRKQISQQQKIPRFLIPLTGFWGNNITHPTYGQCVDVNIYIKQALEDLFKIKYNNKQTYGDLIAVDIVDYNNANSGLFKDWQGHGRVLTQATNAPLFNDNRYEEYAIGSGDHYTFIGNECMGCFNGASASSHEAFAMKTDFPKFYGQYQGFAPNGYYKIYPKNFEMPTKYRLHMNYLNDKIVNIYGPQKQIQYNIQFGTEDQNTYKQI